MLIRELIFFMVNCSNFKMESNNENRCSLCLFCFKSTDNSTDDCDNISRSDQYRFFTFIVRHLLSYGALISADNQEWCRNACKVISDITINGDDNEQFYENVRICQNCEGITRKFSNVYHQMKELEMRIDWEVSKLRDVMGCADKVVSKREKDGFEKAFTNGGGVVTLGEFRNTLKLSCEAYQEIKKKMAVPKVKLIQMIGQVEEFPVQEMKEDLDLEINSVLEENSTTPPNTQYYPTQPEVGNQRVALTKVVEDQVMEHDDEQAMDIEYPVYHVVVKCENGLSPLGSSAPERPIILPEEDPLNPPNKSQSTYNCTTCSLPFTSKYELFQHNMANHIGKYFSSMQHSALSSDQFNHCISDMLDTTLDTFDKVDENYECPFCSNLFPGRQKARDHLVVRHRPILKEKLVDAQKGTGKELLLTTQKSVISKTYDAGTTITTLKRKSGYPNEKRMKKTKNRSSNLYCYLCSLYFPNKVRMFQHDMSNHPEKYFVSVKSEDLTQHQFQICVANMLSVIVEELEKVNSRYQCDLCSKLLSGKQCAKNHLVRKHRSNLREKLIKLQKSSNINLIMNTSGMTNIARHSNGQRDDYNCNICEKVFERRFLLSQHQRYSHPEKFFEILNLLPSSSSESIELFKTYVRYVLEKQTNSLFSMDRDRGDHDQVKCGICSKVLKGSLNTAKGHLISRHRNVLAEKLLEIQKRGKSLSEIGEELEKLKMKGAKIFKKKVAAETKRDFHDPTIAASSLSIDCSLCSISFKTKCNLFVHDVIHHVEKYFSSEKLNLLSNDQFSNTINHLLNNTVDKFPMCNSKYQCTFCPKRLCSRQTSKNHLVSKHRSILKEKLVEVQKCGNVPISRRRVKSLLPLTGKKSVEEEEIKLEVRHEVHSESGSPDAENGFF